MAHRRIILLHQLRDQKKVLHLSLESCCKNSEEFELQFTSIGDGQICWVCILRAQVTRTSTLAHFITSDVLKTN